MRANHPLNRIEYQVMWNRLISVVEEQAQTLVRTAFGTATREAGDTGVPVVQLAPDSAAAQSLMAVAEKIAARCSVQSYIEETT